MNEMSDELAGTALARIGTAFAHRRPPDMMSDSKQLSDVEHDEVMSFAGKRWQEIGFDQVSDCADAIFWFAPDAFAYYLPGFLSAGLREGRTDSNAYDALVNMLDRSPEPDYWDDFFRPRWTLLSVDEIEAVRAWTDWFAAIEPAVFETVARKRVDDTLMLLRIAREEAEAGR